MDTKKVVVILGNTVAEVVVRDDDCGVQSKYIKYIPTKKYFKNGHKNDIAIIELQKPVYCADQVAHHICIPNETFYGSTAAVVAGMGCSGYTSEGWGMDVTEFHKYSLPIPSDEYCRRGDVYFSKIDDNQLCVGCYNNAPCHGDCGSPLVGMNNYNIYELIRMVSEGRYGPQCCKSYPTIFVNGVKYTDWITSITQC